MLSVILLPWPANVSADHLVQAAATLGDDVAERHVCRWDVRLAGGGIDHDIRRAERPWIRPLATDG
jgi:hypothetical protein